MKDDHDPTFSLEGAIRKQVELEDMLNWARKPAPPALPEVQQILANNMQKWRPAVLHMFAKQAFKKSLSIMLP